ncbi:MAG: C-GCAxxG-C-C family protein [Candidatus Omnitrophica bacterium]|nr:C-GCAxxG-C-C family protein [Candidatus Omnitrophota bacterium]
MSFSIDKGKTANRVEMAVCCFKEGLSCSQAILSTYGQVLGIDKVTALKISAPFGGGMARMGETCGAVTGAFMVIGLKYAVSKEEKEKLYGLINKFAEKFKSKNGSILCKELLGYNIGTAEGMKAVREKGLIDTLCPKLVRDAAEILEEIL